MASSPLLADRQPETPLDGTYVPHVQTDMQAEQQLVDVATSSNTDVIDLVPDTGGTDAITDVEQAEMKLYAKGLIENLMDMNTVIHTYDIDENSKYTLEIRKAVLNLQTQAVILISEIEAAMKRDLTQTDISKYNHDYEIISDEHRSIKAIMEPNKKRLRSNNSM